MISVVIEMEFLHGKEDRRLVGTGPDFIPKEIAVATVEERPKISHFTFAPPYPESSLSPGKRALNRYITRNIHGITYAEGDIPYDKLRSCVVRCCRNADRLLSKGPEKAEYLADLLDRPVIDLNSHNCPRAGTQQVPVLCQYPHRGTTRRRPCAFEKALEFAGFVHANEGDIEFNIRYPRVD